MKSIVCVVPALVSGMAIVGPALAALAPAGTVNANGTEQRSTVSASGDVSDVASSSVAAAQADEAHRRLTLTFGPGAVNVAGIDGRHEIIAFRDRSHRHAALLRCEVTTATDDDGDGRLTFSVRDIPHGRSGSSSVPCPATPRSPRPPAKHLEC